MPRQRIRQSVAMMQQSASAASGAVENAANWASVLASVLTEIAARLEEGGIDIGIEKRPEGWRLNVSLAPDEVAPITQTEEA